VSKQHTSLDLNGTAIVEKFVKGGGESRDPNLTNYIFPSYSQEAHYPLKVYRNGVRQTGANDLDYKFWPGGWIDRGDGPGNAHGMVASSSDGTKLAAADLVNNVIRVSSDSGTTWEDRDALEVPGCIALSGDGEVLVAIRGTAVRNLYVSTDLGATWAQLDTTSSYVYSRVAVSRDGFVVLAATSTSELVDFMYSSGWSMPVAGSGYPASQTWVSVAVNYDGTRFAALSLQTGVYVKQYQIDPWALKVGRAPNLGAVSVSDDGLVILFVANGMYASRSPDGGTTWSTIGTDLGDTYGALSADGTKIVIAARNAGVKYSSDSGSSWTTDSYIDHLTSIAGSSDLVKIIAGHYKVDSYNDLYVRNGVGTTPLVFTSETLSPGEVILLEYLTNSTDLLPTLSPNN
jgi:hypothetical protein